MLEDFDTGAKVQIAAGGLGGESVRVVETKAGETTVSVLNPRDGKKSEIEKLLSQITQLREVRCLGILREFDY